MQMTDAGKAMLKRFEGCRLEAYQDVAGVWTIGFGHTHGVKSGDTWTQGQADRAFDVETAEFAGAVANMLRVNVAPCRFDAICSLAYNIGLGAFAKSTLLTCLNRGDFHQAALQFTVWNKAGGQFNGGLLKRRTEEMYLFCSGHGDG